MSETKRGTRSTRHKPLGDNVKHLHVKMSSEMKRQFLLACRMYRTTPSAQIRKMVGRSLRYMDMWTPDE